MMEDDMEDDEVVLKVSERRPSAETMIDNITQVTFHTGNILHR